MLRLLTTIGLALFVLASIWYLPTLPVQILVLLGVGIGLWEYARLVFQEKTTRLFLMTLGVGFASLMTWGPSKENLLGGLITVVFLTFLWEMRHREPLPEVIHRVGLIVLGVCYLALTLPVWSWLKEMGREWVLLILIPASLTDTFGFLVGKSVGRKKMAPVISPNKTWEGFFGSLFGGVFGLWIGTKLFPTLWRGEWIHLVVLGIGISLIAILGDLIESLIKRSVGVKDSSHLIPGHGGALDRLDALIFTAPFFYWFLRFL